MEIQRRARQEKSRQVQSRKKNYSCYPANSRYDAGLFNLHFVQEAPLFSLNNKCEI